MSARLEPEPNTVGNHIRLVLNPGTAVWWQPVPGFTDHLRLFVDGRAVWWGPWRVFSSLNPPLFISWLRPRTIRTVVPFGTNWTIFFPRTVLLGPPETVGAPSRLGEASADVSIGFGGVLALVVAGLVGYFIGRS